MSLGKKVECKHLMVEILVLFADVTSAAGAQYIIAE